MIRQDKALRDAVRGMVGAMPQDLIRQLAELDQAGKLLPIIERVVIRVQIKQAAAYHLHRLIKSQVRGD